LTFCTLTISAHVDGDDSRPWWCDYHTLVSHSTRKEGRESELGMMAERGAWPTGWYGAWWIQHQLQRQAPYDAIKHVEHFQARGVKNVFYFDAGEMGEFVALIHNRRLLRSQWELRFYQNEEGRLMWFGKDAFYRDENPLDLKNYRDFGLPAWTTPDGRQVSSVYDLARIAFDGTRDRWDYSSVRVSPEIDAALKVGEFLRAGPDPVPAEANGSLGRICSYDHSNPFLLEDFKAGVGPMLTLKPEFLHFDNYFDNETLYPSRQAFGPWSIANFRRRLTEQLDDDTRRKLGIDAAEQFDIKQYLQDKPFRSRGLRWHFHNPEWHDDPVWNFYVCSKWLDSDRLFRRLYGYCKSESRRHGSKVIVVGNTVPVFPGGSLAAGALDIDHFEYHLAEQYGPIEIPLGLPPLGRLGGVVRLGAAISSAGYCWPSAYVPKDLSGPGHENLHRVLAFDCLANKGVLDYNYQYLNGYSPGSDESASWINNFIKAHSSYYGRRASLADVGLVFPGQTLLASVSVFTMDPGKCLYDYLGWSQALTDSHFQWDVLLDHQLTATDLGRFKTVVLPSVACLSDEAIEALKDYATGGGTVVISGEAGTRHGVDRFLWHREAAETLLAKLGVEQGAAGELTPTVGNGRCVLCPDSPGKAYYIDVKDGQRSDGGPRIRKAMDKSLRGRLPVVTTDAPVTVGVFTFRDADGHLAVDLVNYDIDTSTDRIVEATDVRLVISPDVVEDADGIGVTVIAPELRTRSNGVQPWTYRAAKLPFTRQEDGGLEIVVPRLAVFCTIRIGENGEIQAVRNYR
jgi:hypothetical protein